MNILRKTLIVLFVAIFCYLPNKYYESEIVFHSECFSKTDNQNHFPEEYFLSYNSPLIFALPQNNLPTNIVYSHVYKIKPYDFIAHNQNSRHDGFYTTSEYGFHINYIFKKLKNSDLIYPFHCFL
jgi:hypothetical protein